MRLSAFIATIIISFVNSGCISTQAQREFSELDKGLKEISAQLDNCRASMDAVTSVQITYKEVLVKRVNDSWAENRFELIRKNELLNDDLKNHFIKFLVEEEKCNKIFIDGDARLSPRLYKISTEYQNLLSTLYEQLLDRKIEIGEFNRKIIEVKNKASQQYNLTVQEIVSNLRSQHNSEVDRFAKEWADNYQRELDRQSRERAAGSQNQRTSPSPLPRSYQTDCYRVGNNVSCTTW